MLKKERAKNRLRKFRGFLQDNVSIDTFEPEYLKFDAAGRLILRGVERVEICEGDKMVLRQKGSRLMIEGNDLTLEVLSTEETVIMGEFAAVRWMKEDGN